MTGEEDRSLRPADGLIDSTSESSGLHVIRGLGVDKEQGRQAMPGGRHLRRLCGGVFS